MMVSLNKQAFRWIVDASTRGRTYRAAGERSLDVEPASGGDHHGFGVVAADDGSRTEENLIALVRRWMPAR